MRQPYLLTEDTDSVSFHDVEQSLYSTAMNHHKTLKTEVEN